MDGLVALSWRIYPAAVLIAVGLAVTVWSVSRGVCGAGRHVRDPMRALALLRGFRVGIIGVSLAGVGAAWAWQLGWLLGLSLIIGGQELLESSIVIATLRRGGRAGTVAATHAST